MPAINPFPPGDDYQHYENLVAQVLMTPDVHHWLELEIELYLQAVSIAFNGPIDPGAKFVISGGAKDLLFRCLEALCVLDDEG